MSETTKIPFYDPDYERFLAAKRAKENSYGAAPAGHVDPVTIPENDPPTPEQDELPELAKHYPLRNLHSRDIFAMLNILSKIGVAEMKNCFSSPAVKNAIANVLDKNGDGEEGKADFSSVGINVVFEIAGVVVTNLPKCEKEIYEFLSGLSGIDVKNLADMDATEFIQMIVDVIRKPEFKDFMKVVSRFLK